jgi:hypothetical protein
MSSLGIDPARAFASSRVGGVFTQSEHESQARPKNAPSSNFT